VHRPLPTRVLDSPTAKVYYSPVATAVSDLTTLVELWYRRQEPESYDHMAALNLASRLEADPEANPAVQGLAWRLAEEVHRAAGWSMPSTPKLPRCCSAAASVRHANTLLVEEVRSELRRENGRVVLLGALGASEALFHCWDALPGHGEVLVGLDRGDAKALPASALDQHGVRWAGPGDLGESLARHSRPQTLGGLAVYVPAPELLVARAQGLARSGNDLTALVFTAAAYATTQAGRWEEALHLAKRLGHGRSPVETAMQLGITDWLGLSVGPITRLSVGFRSLLHSHRNAALL